MTYVQRATSEIVASSQISKNKMWSVYYHSNLQSIRLFCPRHRKTRLPRSQSNNKLKSDTLPLIEFLDTDLRLAAQPSYEDLCVESPLCSHCRTYPLLHYSSQ